MGRLVEIEDVSLALFNKGQSTKRYKVGNIWELNYSEIREALNTVPSVEPDHKEITEQALSCAAELLKLVAMIRKAEKDE